MGLIELCTQLHGFLLRLITNFEIGSRESNKNNYQPLCGETHGDRTNLTK